MPRSDETGVPIELTSDEAIVLLNLLHRWSEEEADGATPSADCFESTAEGAALNSLVALLERELPQPFLSNYQQLVAEARDRLSSSWDYPTLRG